MGGCARRDCGKPNPKTEPRSSIYNLVRGARNFNTSVDIVCAVVLFLQHVLHMCPRVGVHR